MSNLHSISRKPLLLTALVLLLAILACATPASAPGGDAEPAAGEPPPPQPTAAATIIAPTSQPQPALPERRYLTLEFPPRMRAGDSQIVRLTLEVDDRGNIIPTAEVEGNVVTGEVIEIPNLYESHHVVAEARFDMAGMEVRPSELISAPISQGQTAIFYWSIRPAETGIYRGTVWLYLRFVDRSSGEESRKAISVQIVEIQAVNLLGVSANLARATGMLGSVIGTILGFPFFEDILKLLFRKLGRKK